MKDVKSLIGQWMMFLDNPNDEEVSKIMNKNDNIQEAVDELTGMSKDEELRRLAELKEKYIKDEIGAIDYAKEEGWKQGQEEGRKAGVESTAVKMLKMGMSVEVISKATGLSSESINKLKTK